MPFTDFLKATVIASAAAATLLAAITVLAANTAENSNLVLFALGWWILAALFGLFIGRSPETSAAISQLLSGAKPQNLLPIQRSALTLINRLWPLFLATIAAAVVAFWAPQVAGIATGFAIIWSFAWRKQASAVEAVENRDGVRFFVDKTSPFHPIELTRSNSLMDAQ